MKSRKIAKIAFEDGRVFNGYSFGHEGERYGELVFNTSMTGYQEIITDPSYKGQFVAMTYPLIGNYGVNSHDIESRKPFLEGFIAKEFSRIASSWRSEKSIEEYLKENKIVGVEGLDTRALTKHVRLAGAMKAVISTEDMDNNSLVQKAGKSTGLVGIDLVKEVTIGGPVEWNKKGRLKVVVLDCGVKYNIMRILEKKGCNVVYVPASTPPDKILAYEPDGLLVSNGPGDPAAAAYVVKTVSKLIGKLPIFGICFGHQILGLALGGKTYKLKFGHHGANHPVKNILTGAVAITSQNHGFCVDVESMDKNIVDVTHINLNDNTIEGLKHKKLPVFSVQFHPEASPGPHDAEYLFDGFIENMEKKDAQAR